MTDPKLQIQRPSGQPKEEKVLPAAPVRLKPSGETSVSYENLPPEAPEGKRIHERRQMPLVPERRSDTGAATETEEDVDK
jgi:hypothetical protein